MKANAPVKGEEAALRVAFARAKGELLAQLDVQRDDFRLVHLRAKEVGKDEGLRPAGTSDTMPMSTAWPQILGLRTDSQ